MSFYQRAEPDSDAVVYCRKFKIYLKITLVGLAAIYKILQLILNTLFISYKVIGYNIRRGFYR
jgi:hypothetical protein